MYIINLDKNNLYGWEMAQFLSTGGFVQVMQDEIHKLGVNTF